jgi:hypothetical protein
MTTPKTFRAYLDTVECQQNCDPKLHAKLLFTANNINTLNSLVRWARERYPDHYHLDTRKPTGMPYGRDVMQQLWADYLNWAEA